MAPCELTVAVQQLRQDGAFTNNDIVTGVVNLKVFSEMTVSHVEVKLEGITNTAIYIRRNNGQNNSSRERISEEHTVLYHTMVVFPPEDVRSVSDCKEFTLIPGEYEYPFQFQIPLNNACRVEGNSFFKHRATHIQWLLPPTLSGLGEFASIKYYVKATAKRPSLIKSSVRVFSPFNFFPFDSTFPIDNRTSVFPQDFQIKGKIPHTIILPDSKGQKITPQKPPGFFRSLFSHSDPSIPQVSPRTLHYKLEARFGYPACIVRGQPLPVDLFLISKLPQNDFILTDGESSGLGELYLRAVDIRLHCITNVAVRGHSRENSFRERILDFDGKSIKLDFADSEATTDQEGRYFRQLKIPSSIINEAVLPITTPPSFRSCNMTRTYQLFIKVWVSGSATGRTTKIYHKIDVIVNSGLRGAQPEPVYLPPPTPPPTAPPASFPVAHTPEPSKEDVLPTYQVATDH